jgi:hypothetical protein
MSVEQVMKLYGPVLTAVTAATSKSYMVAFDSPVTITCIGVVDGNIGDGNVVAGCQRLGGVVP